jgi:C-terminal processing protease CtpA/Prc
VRGLLGVPQADSVRVTLNAPDGASRRLTLGLSNAPPPFGTWPSQGSRVLDGNIGYLRLATMEATPSVQEVRRWMPRFRTTTGLIIDVRDNTGGDRDALQLIYSYLAAPGDPPRVFTAAAFRLHPAHPDSHLATNHHMYRRAAPEWSASQRRAVGAFIERFTPEWTLPAGHFSDWHYMALDRLNDPDVFHYDRPTIVLMNGRSFSATDIFLAGLKGVRNVTLLGTPSAGGSAYTQEVSLGETPLVLRIGSMASFQADGRLFDGHGVLPDVVVAPTPEFYIGGTDQALGEAIKRLRKGDD